MVYCAAFNNGFIICFITSKNIQNTTITYPISFTNICTAVATTWNETNPKNVDYYPIIYDKTLTKISFHLDYGASWRIKNISFVVIGN